jgi:DNA-binding NarL/FixJ family response regulator
MVPAAEQLVGRSSESGVLEHALDRVDSGGTACLEIAGEPGIGKTRMLRELGARADLRGHVVLAGGASEFERSLPFGVILDALDDYVRGLEPSRLAALDQETRSGLGQLFPSLREPGAGGAGPEADERFHTYRAVARLLEQLAVKKPLVLLLDDVHWADSGSIEMLASLLRRPPTGVLIAVALRPRQQPERLQAALERAERDSVLDRIVLGGLDAREAGELIGAVVGPAAVAELHAQTGGNPFYLEQLARAPRRLQYSPSAGDVSLAGVAVPPAVAASLAEELALLPGSVRRVLEGAAVAGDPFDPELAAAAAGAGAAEVTDAIDELLERDLIRPTELPRRFRFRHPLVRRAVYDAAPGGWRLTAHERSSEALAARGASAAERAHHVESSASPGDRAAMAVLREAGDASAARAPAAAARFHSAALRLLTGNAPPAERLELLSVIAREHAAAGQFADAYVALLKSLELVPPDAVATRVELTAACAGMENLLSRHAQAHARLLAALEELAEPRSPEAVALLTQLSVDAFFRMEYDAMRDWATRALEAAGAARGSVASAGATGLLALGAASSGDVDEAARSASRAADLLGAMSDDELSSYLDTPAQSTIGAQLFLDRLDDAGRLAERVLTLAQATGQGHVLPILFWVGLVRRARGRLGDAVELADTAVEIARLSGHAQGLAWNLFARSLMATSAGDQRTAVAAAEESVETLRDADDTSMPSMWSGFALAAALCESEEANRAEQLLLEAAGGEGMTLVPAAWRTSAFELLTRCRLTLGDAPGARVAAAEARALADSQGLPLAAAMAARAEAAVALDEGDASSAAARALASVEAAAEVGAPIEAALSRVLAGRALAAAAEKERAADELERAAADFEACGATARRDQAELELGKLGRRPHRRSRRGQADGRGIEALSERELEVARLVVDRKTNAQIAAELYLSPKTVEAHIRHLFQKLDVSSRVEVARIVEQADRTAR